MQLSGDTAVHEGRWTDRHTGHALQKDWRGRSALAVAYWLRYFEICPGGRKHPHTFLQRGNDLRVRPGLSLGFVQKLHRRMISFGWEG